MKDKHYKIQVDNTFTTDKNTNTNLLWPSLLYDVFMNGHDLTNIHENNNYRLLNPSIYKTPLFIHYTVNNFWTKQFPLSNKSIMQIFTIKLQYKHPQLYIHVS